MQSANSSKRTSPFLTCFPLLPTAEPYGQGNTRLSHIKRRRLIMPLVALVQKNRAHPQLRTFVWCSALPSSSPLLLAFRLRTSECLYKVTTNRYTQIKKTASAVFFNNIFYLSFFSGFTQRLLRSGW